MRSVKHRLAHYDKRIYIAGRISGLDEYEAQANFAYCSELMKQRGYIPVNPLGMWPNDWSYSKMLLHDLFEILLSKNVFMQDNYRDSFGAKVEMIFSRLTFKTVIFE